MPEPNIAKVIIEQPSGATVFVPQTQVINQFDSVFWVNKTSEAHQPAPDNGATWFTNPIPPNGESPQLNFDDSTTTSYPYHCAKHPTRANEKGVIQVNIPGKS